MAGSIPPLRPGSPHPASTEEPTADLRKRERARNDVVETTAAPARPLSIRSRLQVLFGWKVSSDRGLSNEKRFSHAGTVSGMRPPGAPGPLVDAAENGRKLHDESKRLGSAGPASQRKHLGILKMLEDTDSGSHRPQAADTLSARSWKSLAQTSLGLEFEREVAALSQQKAAEMTALLEGIAQLPSDLASQYQALLGDILLFRNPAERETMLIDLARDVAARLRPQE